MSGHGMDKSGHETDKVGHETDKTGHGMDTIGREIDFFRGDIVSGQGRRPSRRYGIGLFAENVMARIHSFPTVTP